MDDVVLMSDPKVAAIAIDECGEPLVDLRDLRGADFSDHKATTKSHHLVRRGLAERLARAQALLPAGFGLLFAEGHRDPALQRQSFDGYRDRLLAADPNLTPAEAFKLASRFVSPPEVAPHVSGAAIDLTLAGPTGDELDLGTPIDASPEESRGACYFAASTISEAARHHRTVLSEALSSAGLVNYPTEWWHWSYGDRYWALVTGATAAIYGPVAPDAVSVRR